MDFSSFSFSEKNDNALKAGRAESRMLLLLLLLLLLLILPGPGVVLAVSGAACSRCCFSSPSFFPPRITLHPPQDKE